MSKKLKIREVEKIVVDELKKLSWEQVGMKINTKAYNMGRGQILKFKIVKRTHARNIDKIAVLGIDRDKKGCMQISFWSTGLSTDTFFGTQKWPPSLNQLSGVFLDLSDVRGEMKGKQLGIV